MPINVYKEQKRQANLTLSQMFGSWGTSFPNLNEMTNLGNMRHAFDGNIYTFNPSKNGERYPLNGWYKRSSLNSDGSFYFSVLHFVNGYLSRKYNRPASSEYLERLDSSGNDLSFIREYKYYNAEGKYHNFRGPAVVTVFSVSCRTQWFFNGKPYSINDREFYAWCRENGIDNVDNCNKNLSIEDETLIRMKWFS